MVTDEAYLSVVHAPTDVHGAHHAIVGAVLRTGARQVIELGVRGGNTTTMLSGRVVVHPCEHGLVEVQV